MTHTQLTQAIFANDGTAGCTYGYVESSTIIDYGESSPFGVRPILAAVRSVDSYNEWDGPKVARWLEKQAVAFGGDVMSVRFGREGSPVLYLTIRKADGTDAESKPIRLTDEQRSSLADKVISSAKRAKLHPDEAWQESPGVIRLWWD